MTMTIEPTPRSARPFAWSIRRELWENRAVYFAPLAIAGLILLGFAVAMRKLPDDLRNLLALQGDVIGKPYSIAAFALLINFVLVGIFYCLSALQAERRDRSILFWKSLPVSDRTTVLAKVMVPFVLLPAITFAVIAATQLIMAVASTLILLATGIPVDVLWGELALLKRWLVLGYGIVTLTIWYAPVFGWMLLVSAWARRMSLLWAVGPFLGLAIVERVAFDSLRVLGLLKVRLLGAFDAAFDANPNGPSATDLGQLAPVKFLSAPETWIGVAIALACITVAIRLRRSADPL